MAWLFGSSKRAVTQRVARQHDGTVVQAHGGGAVVVSPRGRWHIVFDFDTPEGSPPNPFFGERSATRIGVPFTSRAPFAWALRRRSIVGDAISRQRRKLEPEGQDALDEFVRRLESELTPPAVPLGYGDFDYEFSIETNDADRLRELFSDPALRRSLQDMPSVSLRATQDDEWLHLITAGQTEDLAILYCQLDGTLKDDALLQELSRLLETIAGRMAAMGVAEPARPDLFRRLSAGRSR